MFTLANNVATFVVDRTGVTGSSGVYTITYDAELFNSTKKLLDNGYTVVFKVVLKNVTTKKDTDFRYFVAIHNNVSTKIYFLPDAELSSAGVFKFTLLDIPSQIKTNKDDIADIKADIQDAEHQYTGLNDRMDEVEAFISGETPEHVVHSETYDLFSESFKYPSGRLVIDIRVRPTVDINTATGQIFYGEVPTTDWPIAFAKKPNVTFSSEPSGTNGWVWGRTPPSETKSPGLYIGRATAVSQQNVVIIYHAEGVWKLDNQ